MQLPANLYKIYPGKSVKGVLSMADITPMSISSMNKHVSRFSTLMKFCRDEYGLSENPALGLTFRQKRRHDEERKAYSGEDIKKMIEVIQSHTKRPVGRQWDNVVELLISIRKNPSKSGS